MRIRLNCHMQSRSLPNKFKYLAIETVFFALLFLIFPVLSNYEYNFIELHKERWLQEETVLAIYYGLAELLTSVVYYIIVRQFLFSKRFARFILFTVIYLVAYHFYRSGLYYATAHMTFLPTHLRSVSQHWYDAHSRINFSIVYMSTRLICVVSLAYFIRSMKQDELLNTLREQHLLTELNYLKAQLHPHFFFNTINNIYALALKGSAETAGMVARLGDMMRYILDEAEQDSVSLCREISFLNDYMALERIRHEGHEIIFDVQGVHNEVEIAPLLLLPFIENAFKHGLSEDTNRGFVKIIICVTSTELILDVANSKPVAKQNSRTGIGIRNVQKRLDLLYASRYQLEVRDEQQEYSVTLILKRYD
ncbi:hypothetical protein D0C36_24220 [Mucilaginibacter conchicola]|uniref:Signal transduction histidine kinase internal region domain-containing protein n=1 Tax=Mucilaginibacter conchicola TaxID=2303333 RepID=A0A372NMT7_9SPHI|nr:histidine kinase [Mucilaginibacter conchicola]RFZ89907.1 hypothetical protein D0C36_24220 [Mucilaginibacter conchicola]